MYEEFLSVPDVIEILSIVFGVLEAGGVSSSDEVGDTAVGSGAGVPQYFSGSSVVHGRRPDAQDSVLGVQGSVI